MMAGKQKAAGARAKRAVKKGRRANAYPEIRASTETFEAAPRRQEAKMQPASLGRMPRLEFQGAGSQKPRAQNPAYRDVSNAAAALLGAAAVSALAGAAMVFVAGFQLIVTAGVLAPLFIASSILIYSRLESGGK